MTFKNCEQTWICQLGKPQNLKVLKSFVEQKDKSGDSLAKYYVFIVNALYDTPAFGISGVNKFLNDLTDKVRATINRDKTGKTSSYAHAAKVIQAINYFANKQVSARYDGRYKLHALLTQDELLALSQID